MCLFLMILGGLILLLFLLSRLRLGIDAAVDGKAVTVDAAVGPLRIRVLPGKPKKTKPEKEVPPKKEAAKSPPKEKKPLPKPTLADIRSALDALLPPLKRALGRTRRSIRVKPLDASVTFGGAADPAAAAELYGYAHMAVWTGMPVLEQLLVIPDPHIHIGIDFDAPETAVRVRVGVTLRLGTLVSVALGVGIPALKWFLGFQKKHKQPQPAKEPEQAAPAA